MSLIKSVPQFGSSTKNLLSAKHANVFNDPKGAVRHANLRQLKDRIAGVNTVKKISQVMKVLTQQRIVSIQNHLYKTRAALEGPNRVWEEIKPDFKGKKNLFVVLSTDKGMCGGINASTFRFTRELVRERVAEHQIVPRIITLGDIVAKSFARLFPQQVDWHAAAFPKAGVSFPIAAYLTERIMSSDAEVLTLVYNHYINQISYELTTRELVMPTGLEQHKSLFDRYEFAEGSALTHMPDLHEFSLATFIYQAMVENYASENAARLIAMDGAQKNATELAKLIERLYNKKRQTAITTELLEIVSAAMFTPQR